MGEGSGVVREKTQIIEVPLWISKIRAIGWDLDGTLYRNVPEIQENLNDGVLSLIAQERGKSRSWVEQEYARRLERIGSNTQVISSFGLDGPQIIDQVFDQVPLELYIQPDLRLQRMFSGLSDLTNVLITHNRIEQARRKLACLELNEKVFDLLVPVYDWKMNKQDPELFRKILEKLRLRPEEMLYLGDREVVDILPARAAGLHTGIVWGKSDAADISLPTVYDVGRLFGGQRVENGGAEG